MISITSLFNVQTVFAEVQVVDIMNNSLMLYVDSPRAFVNNVEKPIGIDNSQTAPVLVNGRTLVPLRFIASNFGADVTFDDATREITITKDQKTAKLTLGNNVMKVDSQSYTLDVAAEAPNGTTMLPLRAVAETLLNKHIFWDRNLIVISDQEINLDPKMDKQKIDMLINLFFMSPSPVVTINPNKPTIDSSISTNTGGIVTEGYSDFTQGSGYEKGAYDTKAVQPTRFNWNRLSRFQGPSDPQIKWTFHPKEANEWFDSSPAIGRDGIIYQGSVMGRFYAIDPLGKTKWIVDLGSNVEIRSSPSISGDGTIFFGAANWDDSGSSSMFCERGKCYAGGLFAVHPDGTMKWKRLFDEVVTNSSPSIAEDGTIIIGSGSYAQDGKIYAVNPSDGSVKWSWNRNPGNGEGFYTAAVINSKGIMFDHNVILDTQGNYRHLAMYAHTTFSNPLLSKDGNTIYYGTYTGSVVAMGLDGIPKWEIQLQRTNGSNRVSSNPVMSLDGILYLGDEAGNIYALNPDHLVNTPSNQFIDYSKNQEMYRVYNFSDLKVDEKSWTFPAASWIRSLSVDSNGDIFAITESGEILSLSKSGALRWKMNLNTRNYDQVIGPENTIYVSSGDQIVAIGQK